MIPYYAFPGEVRRILHTTNAIEAMNATLRWAVRAHGHFRTDEAALKRKRCLGGTFRQTA
ncbi:hypothetical protein FOHLNKBM_6346 [Methylobacterium longum]|nr:hypothetical protein FOHLNKBM_6346 [Methylobacterium longum]